MAQVPAVPPAVPPPVPPPVVYAEGDAVTPNDMTEEFQIMQILHWIGFITDAQKDKSMVMRSAHLQT